MALKRIDVNESALCSTFAFIDQLFFSQQLSVVNKKLNSLDVIRTETAKFFRNLLLLYKQNSSLN